MKTALLEKLYRKYNIYNLGFGIIHDKLGDVYEEYCVQILNSPSYLQELKMNTIFSFETNILKSILDCYNINYSSIISIEATNYIPHRATGGNSKTDIIAYVRLLNGTINLPISCKQSTVAKVALAEFDVETICREMGITNPRLKALLLKHQIDCSAKNFTQYEKQELFKLMTPIRRDFVRWVLTGSPHPNVNDLCIPNSIIKFSLSPPNDRYNINVANGDFNMLNFSVMTIESYIDKIIYNPNGTVKSGGFGTGLSWTYATGSKGQKMQFKG